jgi:hypothetical protein
MIYSAILSIIYLPVIIAMYGLIKLSKTPIKSIWRDLQISACSFLTGFFVTTICLCAFHYSYSNSTYFSSNIRKLLHFTGGGYARPPFQEWLPNASWLILPGSIFIAAVVFIVCGVFSKNAKAQSVQDIKYINAVLAAVIISGCLNLFVDIVIHQWSLQVLYFNQTIPVYMLGLGALLHACKTKMSQIQGRFLLAVCIFCFITTLYITNHYYFTWSDFFGIKLLGALSCLITVMVAGATLLFFARKHFLIQLCAILYLFLINIFSFSPAFGNFISYDAFASTAFREPLKSNYSIFNTTIALSKKLDQIDPFRICHIWYNESEFLGPLFRQVNATNYLNCGDRRINKQFPLLQDFSGPIGSEGHFPQSGNEILIITEINDHLNKAEKNLALFSLKIINS